MNRMCNAREVVLFALLVSRSIALSSRTATSRTPRIPRIASQDLVRRVTSRTFLIETTKNDKLFSLASSAVENQSAEEEGLGRRNSDDDADRIFNIIDVDGSGTIDLEELTAHLTTVGYTEGAIQNLFSNMDVDKSGEISRERFRRALVEKPTTERDADLIFAFVDMNGSGSIDLQELTDHLVTAGYTSDEVQRLFSKMDTDKSGEISRTEFRRAILDESSEEEICPSGYFMNSVKQSCERLGPLGRLSQYVETFGPLNKAYNKISNLFGVDTKRISNLGVSFALSYSIISNLNGALSFSIAWLISCKRTGLSPLVPGQWRSLLTSYGMIYGLIQVLRPFRVAAAIAMSKLSAEYLEITQRKYHCSRSVAVGLQFSLGLVMLALCSLLGVTFASLVTGVPIMGP